MPGFELIGKEEFQEVKELFDNSGILFRHGFENLRNGIYKVKEFESDFANYIGSNDALAVSSGTAAILIALKALGIGKGDEVIVPAFTFVATIEAVVEVGAIPVVCGIDKSLNMCPYELKKCFSEKTKAIIVVHMLGTPTAMGPVIDFAKSNRLFVVEDTAWGCGGSLDGKFLGTIGDVGTYSFDFAKTMTTGEGGMVVCKDPKVLERAKAYHDHGHENNPSVPRWKDTRSSTGFNYRMSELQGAVGKAQLKKLTFIVDAQRRNANRIKELLTTHNLELRIMPEGSKPTYDAVVFLADSPIEAENYRKQFLENGVGTKILPEAITWHFAGDWDHISELVLDEEMISNSRELLSRCVAIPISVNMDENFFNSIKKVIS